MGTVSIRPNQDLANGYGTNPDGFWTTLQDQSTSTLVYGAPTWSGNSLSITGFEVAVYLDNATGFVPAGRQIISVAFNSQIKKSTSTQEAGCVSWRYGLGFGAGGWIEATRHTGTADGTGAIQLITTTLNSMTRQDGGTEYGAWTYDMLDNMVAVLGQTSTGKANHGQIAEIWAVVTYSDLPYVPTGVTPATGTITVPNPTLGGTLGAIPSGQSQKMEWQFATDTGFTTNVKTVTESNGDLRASGATTESPTIPNLALTNGTWYMRGRAIDQYGIAGAYSAYNTLTVNVPALPVPTAVTPANAATVTTMTPTYGGTLGTDTAGRQQKMEWQTATDNAFTLNAKSLVEADADFRASGATTEVLPLASKLTYAQGTTWYLRGRSVGNDGTTSAWSATTSYTLSMAAPPTPTGLTPVQGANLTTNIPTLGATLGAASENRTVKAKWELSTTASFNSNVRTIVEPDVDLRVSGATTETTPVGQKLFQGLWYIHVKEVDQYGQEGAYSTYTTFTVAHPPTASPQSPANGANVVYAATTAFTWTFTDTSTTDTQTAYQIIVERNDTGAVVFDSNKTASVVQTANLAVSASYKDIQLRWKIRVWDTDDVAGAYSPYQLFLLSDLPVITITAPTNAQQIGTGTPTVTWTLDGATTQVSRRLVFTRTSDSVVVYDTGTVQGSQTTWIAPSTILENQKNYSVAVTVVDALGMSATATRNFSTLYVGPNAVVFTVSSTSFEDNGYVGVDWTATSADGTFVKWFVYRKLTTSATWTLLFSTNDPNVHTYHDWSASNNITYDYAVTQSADRSGLTLESAIVPVTGVLATGTHYWLINPNDETYNLRLSNVKDDGFSDAYEEAELIIIGRGRKVNHGTRLGYDGSLSVQLRDDALTTAREKRLKLEAIRASSGIFYLRNPFGDVIQVSLGAVSFSRVAGVGTNEYSDATIPYKEVF